MSRADEVRIALLAGLLFSLTGCRHTSISAPAPPLVSPGIYTVADYNKDLAAYTTATTVGTLDADIARQKRNDIVYGLMGDIEIVYGDYYRRLFTTKNNMAIGADSLALGLGTAASIATHTATKTIFSALGTGFTGVGLSVDKNYFAQQSFSVIGLAMQTRRDKVRGSIMENLKFDADRYPLRAAEYNLVALLNAGTLAAGLQELQEDAGAETAKHAQGATGSTGPSGATGGSGSRGAGGATGTTGPIETPEGVGPEGTTGATGPVGSTGSLFRLRLSPAPVPLSTPH